MFDYETGIFFAFLLWLYNAIMIVVSVNSRLERNLNRIGQRLSWLTLTPKPMDSDDLSRSTVSKILRYLLIVGISLPFVLLSWLNVALAIATIIYRRAKDSGAPQAVREFRWKMKNADLTFDQLVKEMMKISEDDPSKFEEFRTTIVNELEERGLPHG
jgi:urea transporter